MVLCQGCPLSPILFSIYLEPFLSSVRMNPIIHGVKVKVKEHILSGYADDVLFYVQQPRITLPNLLRLIQEFQSISNFKHNKIKSEILNISILMREAKTLKPVFRFTWHSSTFKYLGIYLTSNLTSLFWHNYLPLLIRIKLDLHIWSSLCHLWLGKDQCPKDECPSSSFIYLPNVTSRSPRRIFLDALVYYCTLYLEGI